MEAEELLLKKRKKKDLEQRIDEIEKLLEEKEEQPSEDRIKRLEELLEKLIEIAQEPDEEDEILNQIKSSLDDIRTYLISKDDSIYVRHIKSLEEAIKDYLRKLREEESRNLEEIKLLLRSLQEQQLTRRDEIKDLEDEIRNLKDLIIHMNKLLDSDSESRKEILREFSQRLSKLEEKLREIYETHEEKEKIKELHEELLNTRDSILYVLSKIEEMEARDIEAINHLVEEIKSELQLLKEGIMDEKELRGRLDSIHRRLKAVINLVTKNSKALESHGHNIGEILEELRELEESVSSMREDVSSMKEYTKRLMKEIDQSLKQTISSLREIFLETLREREKNLAEELEKIHNDVSQIHDDLLGVITALKREDITAKLKEIEEHMKFLAERSEKGIMERKEIREHLENVERKLEDVENSLPREDLQRLRDVVKKVEEDLKSLNEKIGRAGAVITEEDLRSILKELEELRFVARKVKESGVKEILEDLTRDVKEMEEHIKNMKDNVVRIPNNLEELKNTLESVREMAALLEDILKKKIESIESIISYSTRIGETSGVVGSHIIKRRVSNLKKEGKIMEEISRITKRIESLTKKISKNVETKRLKGINKRENLKEYAMRALLDEVRKLRPGESIDLSEFSERKGIREDLVREVASELVRIGEIALELEKPLIPIFGGWKIRRL